jgi:hypothetical protein
MSWAQITAWTSWQAWSAALIVLAAVVYLVWKLGFASRSRPKKKGPDVPASRLVRRRPK